MRIRARIDNAHRDLLDLASQLGGFVVDTHQVGGVCPDAFVAIRGIWHAVEIKSVRGRLTKGQSTLRASAPLLVWRWDVDVLKAFRIQPDVRQVKRPAPPRLGSL